MKRELIYTGFERFWHWSQAALVIMLALTGFEIHFGWGLWGFETAVHLHRALAWIFVGVIAFAIFWHVTTGAWRQYRPGGNFIAMVVYYAIGIFRKQPHPVRKTALSKLNPLQKVSYLVLKVLVIPIQVTTGFLYYYYNQWPQLGLEWSLGPVALAHTIGAFALIAGMIGHVYLTTTGRTPLTNLKAMVTGWEELEAD